MQRSVGSNDPLQILARLQNRSFRGEASFSCFEGYLRKGGGKASIGKYEYVSRLSTFLLVLEYRHLVTARLHQFAPVFAI